MHRFDSLSRVLSSHASRRVAVKTAAGGVAGGAALAVLGSSAADAQDATPEASPVPTDSGKVPFLFVQSGSSATFTKGTDATWHLAMKGHTGGTIYFSDRPERIFGEAPTQQFLDGLGFSADNPPNAAIVTGGTDGEGDVLVVELTNPAFDAASGDLSYDVTPLEAYSGDGLSYAASNQQDMELAPDLGSTSLFIDDCPDTTASCTVAAGGCYGEIHIGTCWSWSDWQCHACDSFATMSASCNSLYDKCNGNCVAVPFEQCG